MTDRITKEARSINMSKIRSKNTKLEIEVRKLLFKRGFRYRINYPIFGKPDIAFPLKKVAIFINGCFWHQHGCRNSSIPSSNSDYWIKKLKNNVERDDKVLELLNEQNWKTFVLWECEIKNNIEKEIEPLVSFLK